MSINSIFSELKTVLEILALIGGCAFVIGLCWAQFKSGQSKRASDQTIENTNTINLLSKQIDALEGVVQRQEKDHKESVTAYHKEIGDLKAEVGRLNGIIQEKERKLAEFREILQGRSLSPELEAFIKSSGEFQQTLMAFMTDVKNYIETSSK